MHSLAGLTVQPEATRLLAAATGAAPELGEQIARAQALARDGLFDARRAVRALRGDAVPGPGAVPSLVEEFGARTGRPATLEVLGTPRPLPADAGLTVYRCVQEALTNVSKHAGAGATVAVRLVWAPGSITVEVRDRGGDAQDSGLPSSGAGLLGLRERVHLLGGASWPDPWTAVSTSS